MILSYVNMLFSALNLACFAWLGGDNGNLAVGIFCGFMAIYNAPKD